jgi:hypothetical protein
MGTLSVLALLIGATSVTTPKAGASPAGTISVHENTPLHPVPSDYSGFSIETGNVCYIVQLAQSDPAFVQLFKTMGPGIFNVGAGTGDRYASWSTTAQSSCAWKHEVVTPSLVDAFFSFAESVGYRVMWQVPLDNGALSADAAEAEAAYVSTMADVDSIEIGNESDRYQGGDTQTTIDDWDTVDQDYRADGGTAPLSGPSVSNQLGASYIRPFLAQDASKIDAVTQHYYVGPAMSQPTPTCQDLLNVGSLPSTVSGYVAIAGSYDLPLILNESNSYSEFGVPGVSNAFCSALWAADLMLIGLESGAQGLYFHGTADYPAGNIADKPEYFTPINEDGSPAPEYYGMLFYAQMTQAGGNQVKVSTPPPGLDAYAVSGGDGRLRVAVINRNAGARTVTLHTANSYHRASEIKLRAPSLTSLSGVTLGGASVTADGTWTPQPFTLTVGGSTLSVKVPAYTGVIITYAPSAS